MGKIKLANGLELDIQLTSTDSECVALFAKDLTIIELYVKAFTKENLEKAYIIDDNDEIVLVLKNKYLTGFDGSPLIDEEGKFIVCFRLADVYSLEERIAMLELENEQLKNSQEVQDEAIIELASIIAE